MGRARPVGGETVFIADALDALALAVGILAVLDHRGMFIEAIALDAVIAFLADQAGRDGALSGFIDGLDITPRVINL